MGGIRAYSHNRVRSPDAHTCPLFKAATQTVPCDDFGIPMQSEIKPEGLDANTNEVYVLLCVKDERSTVFYRDRLLLLGGKNGAVNHKDK